MADATPLKENDKIKLISAGSLISNDFRTVDITEGVSRVYKFDTVIEGNNLVATYKGSDNISNGGTPTTPTYSQNPEVYSLVSTPTASYTLGHMLNVNFEGAITNIKSQLEAKRLAADTSIKSDAPSPIYYDDNSLLVFGSINGGRSKTDKSNVDLDSIAVSAGIAKIYDKATASIFVEYGYGKFNGNTNGVKSDGNTRAYGAGLLGRHEFTDAAYIHGFIKSGKIKTKFDAKLSSQNVNYDTSAGYFGTGFDIGYISNFGDFTLDNKLGYIYTYTGEDKVAINGENIKFDKISSHISKYESKITYAASKKIKPYASIRAEYEFDGEALLRPKLTERIRLSQKGFSGGAIGLEYKPTNLSIIEFEASSIGGKRDEFGGKLNFGIKFNFPKTQTALNICRLNCFMF